MKAPIFLEPIFKERIWGGTKLKDQFGYDISSGNTGECWAISAHPNGQSMVKSGAFAGKKLGELWKEESQMFGSSSEAFPLLIKIIDASDDLSVQVHPDDEYAGKHENGELGKTECWYILECDPGSEIIFGHHAASKEEFADIIHTGRWDELLCRIQVKQGDFFYVPSGTLHALGKGIVVLETQQSSDTTYRVYDYDRRDADGNLRELHLAKAIEVTTVPHQQPSTKFAVSSLHHGEITEFVSNRFFTVQRWSVRGLCYFEPIPTYVLLSVISGSGSLTAEGQSYRLSKGDHVILPLGFGAFELNGQMDLIMSKE